MRIILIVIIAVVIYSCRGPQKIEDKIVLEERINIKNNNEVFKTKTIAELLQKSLSVDTLEVLNNMESAQSLVFFKSGEIFSDKEKNAIAVYSLPDSTYSISIYKISKQKWLLVDSLPSLSINPPQFDIILDDYNFDGSKDIYLQTSASMGWSLSRGYLLVTDPLTKKISLHKEAEDLANMTPNSKTQTVTSETWNGYNQEGQHQITVYTNKWIKGKLKTIKKEKIIVKS